MQSQIQLQLQPQIQLTNKETNDTECIQKAKAKVLIQLKKVVHNSVNYKKNEAIIIERSQNPQKIFTATIGSKNILSKIVCYLDKTSKFRLACTSKIYYDIVTQNKIFDFEQTAANNDKHMPNNTDIYNDNLFQSDANSEILRQLESKLNKISTDAKKMFCSDCIQFKFTKHEITCCDCQSIRNAWIKMKEQCLSWRNPNIWKIDRWCNKYHPNHDHDHNPMLIN